METEWVWIVVGWVGTVVGWVGKVVGWMRKVVGCGGRRLGGLEKGGHANPEKKSMGGGEPPHRQLYDG